MFWKKCNSCKKEINYSSPYYVCSVSTCNSKTKGLSFCSVNCYDRHLPGARHRDSYAIEEISPDKSTREAKRSIVTANTAGPQTISKNQVPKDILIVVSKLKNYIKLTADMNTSGSVMETLSDKVREICDQAVDEARANGRKTVLDRDFK